MDQILNYLLAGVLGYLMLIGLKDKEPPDVSIKFPKDGYEFRSSKSISILATDNKGIKSVTYIIDNEVYHVEDGRNPMASVWNPCNLSSGKHTLMVEVSDFSNHTSSTNIIEFYISPDLTSDCNGDCDGKAFLDECGVCSGGNTEHIQNSDRDCNGDCFGTAIIDQCEVCSGGETNHIENSDKDCNGQCFGLASKDGCGVCDIDETNNCTDDCNGDEGGAAFWDDCGNCVAGSTMNLENYLMDDCGQCYTTQSELDQQENNAMDLCGICSGNDTSCNYGLLTLSDLNFNQLKIWNNSTCSGNPYYIMDDYFCLDNNGACFSYSINFEPDYNLGVFIFSQLIEFNNGNSTTLSGQWTLDGSGICLDYDDVESVL